MRIAQVAPLYERVPPTAYGGTERVIASLSDALARSGHDVTLFASGTSTTLGTLAPMTPAPLRVRMSKAEMVEVAPHFHLKMLSEVYRRADEFDVIHSHVDIWTLPFAEASPTPTVLTMHGRLDIDLVRQTLPWYPAVPLVSISDHQREAVADLALNWAGTVPNGLDLSRYLESARGTGEYLAFVGRISPEKGPIAAVDIAERSGRTLRVAAKIDPLDMEYYERMVAPRFASELVEFVGELGEPDKPTFYAGAAATLFPSDWPEPFGLVMIESMAAGTPVIALRRGSVPEVVVDGVTGFICDDVDGMRQAVDRLGEIDPDDCRTHARRFSAAAMCAGYESVYERMVEASRTEPSFRTPGSAQRLVSASS